MPSYTIVMEYKGGTYVAQKQAGNVRTALKKWVKDLDCDSIYGLCDKGKMKLIMEVAGDAATPLAGLENVWCISCSLSGGLALINVIRTHEEENA